jgi:hypothetical protein
MILAASRATSLSPIRDLHGAYRSDGVKEAIRSLPDLTSSPATLSPFVWIPVLFGRIS